MVKPIILYGCEKPGDLEIAKLLTFEIMQATSTSKIFNPRLYGLLWQNIYRDNIVCNLWQGRESGDEFHYLFECTEFAQSRVRLISQKYRCSPNAIKYCAFICSNSVVELSLLCKFIRIVNSKVCPYVGRRV